MPYCKNYPCGSLLCGWYGCLQPQKLFARVLLGVMLVGVPTSAEAVPYDCPTIRSYVAQYGKAAAIAWALRSGYSWGQIMLVQRACTGRQK